MFHDIYLALPMMQNMCLNVIPFTFRRSFRLNEKDALLFGTLCGWIKPPAGLFRDLNISVIWWKQSSKHHMLYTFLMTDSIVESFESQMLQPSYTFRVTHCHHDAHLKLHCLGPRVMCRYAYACLDIQAQRTSQG